MSLPDFIILNATISQSEVWGKSILVAGEVTNPKGAILHGCSFLGGTLLL